MRPAYEDAAWADSGEPAYPGRDAIAPATIARPAAPAPRPPGRKRRRRRPAQQPSAVPQAAPAATTATATPDVIDLVPPELLGCVTPTLAGDPEPWAVARACLRSLPVATLRQILKSPALTHALPRLVPLLKVSDVIPCLQGPGMVELVVPCLEASQCKLVGPELATLIAPALHLNWMQLRHLPLETVVLIPTETFLPLPIQLGKQLPDAHWQYVAPYVKGARKVNHDHHDLALGQGLCQILHLYTHKVLDPEHIPGEPQLCALQRDGALPGKLGELRWLVDAVMTPSVEAVQVGSLKLTTLILALRKVALSALARELELALKLNKHARGQQYGADGVAYTQSQATAVQHAWIGAPDVLAAAARTDGRGSGCPLADALNDAFDRHAGLAVPGHGRSVEHPLPTRHHVAVICIELAAARPPTAGAAWHEIEAVLHEQLGESRNRVTIQEVRLHWASDTTTVYRRHCEGRYLRQRW